MANQKDQKGKGARTAVASCGSNWQGADLAADNGSEAQRCHNAAELGKLWRQASSVQKKEKRNERMNGRGMLQQLVHAAGDSLRESAFCGLESQLPPPLLWWAKRTVSTIKRGAGRGCGFIWTVESGIWGGARGSGRQAATSRSAYAAKLSNQIELSVWLIKEHQCMGFSRGGGRGGGSAGAGQIARRRKRHSFEGGRARRKHSAQGSRAAKTGAGRKERIENVGGGAEPKKEKREH